VTVVAATFGQLPQVILQWRVSEFLLWLELASWYRKNERIEDGLTYHLAFADPESLQTILSGEEGRKVETEAQGSRAERALSRAEEIAALDRRIQRRKKKRRKRG